MILLTGSEGLLGRELQELGSFLSPTHSELDITILEDVEYFLFTNQNIDLIVHCAAYTDVAKAEIEKEKCYLTNVVGTHNIAQLGIPVIYISTEYIFDGERGNYSEEDIPNPRNFYALTKLLGEFVVKETTYVIIRTLFKPRPFEHMAACIDQYTTGDYVDIIAKEIMKVVNDFSAFENSIINIGTVKKSTYDLAIQTKEVIPITVESIAVRLPKDTSLNIDKWRAYNAEHRLC